MLLNEKSIITINGVPQKIHLWGTSLNAPILLFLHGGPGNPFRHKIRKHLLPLTDSFILAAYDQRGTGGSYSPSITPYMLTLDNYVTDVIEWAEYLAKRFNQKGVYLVADSFGSYIGTIALHRREDLFLGYIGFGQVVNTKRTLLWQYQETLKKCQEFHESKNVAELLRIGEPKNGEFQTKDGREVFAQLVHPHLERPGTPSYKVREIRPFNRSLEYTHKDKVGWKKGFPLSQEGIGLWPNHDYDLEPYGYEFHVPYYVFQGYHDYITPPFLVEEYMKKVRAPKKKLLIYEHCGHEVAFESPERFMIDLRIRFPDKE